MPSWWKVLADVISLLPDLFGYCKERTESKKKALMNALQQREDGWDEDQNSKIFNGPRPSVP